MEANSLTVRLAASGVRYSNIGILVERVVGGYPGPVEKGRAQVQAVAVGGVLPWEADAVPEVSPRARADALSSSSIIVSVGFAARHSARPQEA